MTNNLDCEPVPFEIGDIVEYNDGFYLVLQYFGRCPTVNKYAGIYNVYYLGGVSGNPQIINDCSLIEGYSREQYLKRYLP